MKDTQAPIPADELVITPEQQAAVDALAGAALAPILLNMLARFDETDTGQLALPYTNQRPIAA